MSYTLGPCISPHVLFCVQLFFHVWLSVWLPVSKIVFLRILIIKWSTPLLPDESLLFLIFFANTWGFPDSSVGKESACNAGDPSLIPGSGSSPGERIGHPLQYSWASLVAQSVKNLPAMQKTLFQSLGGEDLLEKEMATHSWRIPWTEEPGGLQSMGSQRVRHDWVTNAWRKQNRAMRLEVTASWVEATTGIH